MTERKFTMIKAVPEERPLLLSLVGAPGSGKTWSALRLGTGMQRVYGGTLALIDTESKRALHYAEDFDFHHVDFQPPHSPLDYLAAIEQTAAQGARVIIIDSMTHEHTGVGGVMDEAETLLDKWCGDDEGKRQRNFLRALSGPKRKRAKLVNRLVQFGSDVAFIFCYRGKQKIDMTKKGSDGQLMSRGISPISTSELQYEMFASFVLPPGSDGVPILESDLIDEKSQLKYPAPARKIFPKPEQLSEDVGERFAQWAMGPKKAKAEAPAKKPTDKAEEMKKVLDIIKGADAATLRTTVAGIKDMREIFNESELQKLRDAVKDRRAELKD